MIAVQLMNQDHLRCAPNSSAAAIKPEGEQPPKVTEQFQPLDPSIVNEAIPAFFIGRNKEGFWVARDVKGKVGGIFLFENSAVWFARRNSWPTGCAIIFQSERFELDLENKGNPIVGNLGRLKRFAIGHQPRVTAFINKMMKAVRCRLKDFRFI